MEPGEDEVAAIQLGELGEGLGSRSGAGVEGGVLGERA